MDDQAGPRQPSIRQLRALHAVAQKGGFRAAAEALALTQPAVSAAVGELEQLLGARLFDRGTRGVALTAAGAAVLDHAQGILNAFDQGIAATHRTLAGQRRRVRLATLPSAMHLVAARVARWQKGTTPVDVELRDLVHEELVAALVAGEIDIGLATELDLPPGLLAAPVQMDPLVAVLPAAHPLAARDSLRWRELRGQPLALFARGSTYELALLALRQAAVAVEGAHRLQYSEPLYSLARSGLAIGIISRLYTETALLRGLKVVPLRDPLVQRQIVLLARRQQPVADNLVMRCFDDLLQSLGSHAA
jgi:LysR family transcriptional regulator, carnitine catabolism transcriptional activator